MSVLVDTVTSKCTNMLWVANSGRCRCPAEKLLKGFTLQVLPVNQQAPG
jgi:hypothetical protein